MICFFIGRFSFDFEIYNGRENGNREKSA